MALITVKKISANSALRPLILENKAGEALSVNR